ncbi:uncharacterized protein LOC129870501 isoform X2 [Solanum dulcamara]|uniref:uncharacterized protein LOC129870501 isoform X2 n=1 Tax=Solanum dulcamara TaxID=45834 RepID=UPI00248651A7|nr:uncharacterized protein LOC129870501 isoform X2 [Solanum dulcamara]
MKITGNEAELPAITFPQLDLFQKSTNTRKPPRRKTNNFTAGVKLRRDIGGTTPKGRRSRPETPLLRWKFNEDIHENASVKEETSPLELDRKCSRNNVRPVVSVRKLAAGLFRQQQLPEVNHGQKLGFEAGRVEGPFQFHYRSKVHDTLINDPVQSPRSVFGPTNGLFHKLSHSAMEGATKWDPVGQTTAVETKKIYGFQKLHDKQVNTSSMISTLEAELECARARIHQLETEQHSSKKKLEQFLRKLSEEKAAWRCKEHEKIRAIMDDMRADFSRERKNRKRLEIFNSKLVNELADAKSSAKRYLQNYEKERQARGLIEEVCDELAKELGEDKAEVEEMKRESLKFTEEVDEERKMLQMAEVWREERVQMKLVDAKVMLEEKYSQMNKLIGELESFLNSRGRSFDVEEMKRAEQLQQTAASVSIRDIRELTYEPPNPDDIFSVFEEIHSVEPDEKEIQPCTTAYSPASHASNRRTLSPDGGVYDFNRYSHAYVNQSGNLEEEGSEWETVTHLEEQGSIYSLEGSISSVNKNCRYSNVSKSRADSGGNGDDGTSVSEISEVCSGPARQLTELSSASKLWKSRPSNGDNFKIKSLEGTKGRLSNGRLSNGAILSPEHGSSKGDFSPSDLGQEWSSPESGNSQIARGMKGCIEWPHNSQKKSLKAKLLQARTESQKVQLRQVLKQKI